MKKKFYCIYMEEHVQFVADSLSRAKLFVEVEDDPEEYEILEVISTHTMKRKTIEWTKK